MKIQFLFIALVYILLGACKKENAEQQNSIVGRWEQVRSVASADTITVERTFQPGEYVFEFKSDRTATLTWFEENKQILEKGTYEIAGDNIRINLATANGNNELDANYMLSRNTLTLTIVEGHVSITIFYQRK